MTADFAEKAADTASSYPRSFPPDQPSSASGFFPRPWFCALSTRSPSLLCLGIETSCDETAAAVVRGGREILSSVVRTQIDLHRVFGGVVPEIACRAHAEAIGPVVEKAVADAGLRLADIDVVAVTSRPGLIGALLVGVSAAKSLAWALGKPIVGVDHIEAHLFSRPWLEPSPAQKLIPAMHSARSAKRDRRTIQPS